MLAFWAHYASTTPHIVQTNNKTYRNIDIYSKGNRLLNIFTAYTKAKYTNKAEDTHGSTHPSIGRKRKPNYSTTFKDTQTQNTKKNTPYSTHQSIDA